MRASPKLLLPAKGRREALGSARAAHRMDPSREYGICVHGNREWRVVLACLEELMHTGSPTPFGKAVARVAAGFARAQIN